MEKLHDMFLEVEEDQKETWKIENDNVASWVLDKVRDRKEDFERFERVALEKMEQIKMALEQEKKKYENETSFFIAKLQEYSQSVKMKETKTQKTYALPGGKLVMKNDKHDFKVDKEKVLNAIIENDFFTDTYIKEVHTKDLAWGDLKKNLIIDTKKGNIIYKETGEVLDIEGLSIEVKPGEFKIEF